MYAEVHLKYYSIVKHKQVLPLHLLPTFGTKRLDAITRDSIKHFSSELVAKEKTPRKKAKASAGERTRQPITPEPIEKLSRNSVRLILATLRVILAHALEDGIIQSNPAAALGRLVLIELRDKRLLDAYLAGKTSIMDDVVFPAPTNGGVLDPDNLYDRFLPCLVKAKLRHIRLHDLRHSFGAQLIQSGASLAYVKVQMGHSSIQVTVDIYVHLVPGANVSFVDRLDSATIPQQHATPAQTAAHHE
jgi:hypothetical protein